MKLFLFIILMMLFSHVQAKQKILILHSYAQEYPWTKQQHKGFVSYLKNQYNKPLEIVTEHLDSKRILFDKKYKQFFLEYLHVKYADYNVDIVYTTDDNGLSFLKEYENDIFVDTPVVFSGINNLSIQHKLNKKRYSGVFETKNIKPNIELIHTFSPQTKNIYFIGDQTSTYKSIEQKIKKIKNEFKNIHFEFIADKSISSVIKELKNISLERTFIILTTIGGFVDDNGKNLTLQESISNLTAIDKLIFLSMEDAYMYPGVVGGYVTNGLKQGEYAAKIVLKLFANKNIEHLDYITKSPNTYLFDQKSLNNARLFLASNIDKNVQIINPNDGFYKKYNEIIINTIFLLFVILSITLVVVFLTVKEKNKKIAKNSKEIEDKTLSLEKIKNQYLTDLQVGHWDLDLATQKLECSIGFYQILEVSSDLHISALSQLIEYIYPQDKQLVQDFIQDCLKNEKSGQLEHRILLSKHTDKKILHEIDLQMDNNGKLIHLIGTIHDTT